MSAGTAPGHSLLPPSALPLCRLLIHFQLRMHEMRIFFSWNNNGNGNFHTGRALPFAVTVESYWFTAVPFQSMPVPVFIGLPGGSSSRALYLHGKAARTKCLGNMGLLQSHKHAAVCSRAAVRAPQPASILGRSRRKGPGLLRITKPNRRAKVS